MVDIGSWHGWWWQCSLLLAFFVARLVAVEPDAALGEDLAVQQVVVAGLRLDLPVTWRADETPAGGCLAVWREAEGESDLVLAAARAPRVAMTSGFMAWVDAQRRSLLELGEHGVEIVEDQDWQANGISGWSIVYRFPFISRRWYHRAHLLEIDGLGLIITIACPEEQQAEYYDRMIDIASSFAPIARPDRQGTTP